MRVCRIYRMEIGKEHINGINPDFTLLFKYFRGWATGEEGKRVEDWMRVSEENEKTALQTARIFYTSQTRGRILSRNSIEAYKMVQKRIDKRKKNRRLYRISIVAACFVGLLVMSTAISFLLSKSSVLVPQQITVCANRGVRTSLDLPDGSIVYLNSGSTLSYPSSYDEKERKVMLVGEAYFSVKHDPERPFIVSVSHDRLKVKVLGTEFNVRAYEKEEVVQTTLVSGAVDIVMEEEEGKTSERNLYPSEKAVYDLTDKTLEVMNVDVENEIAWKDGRLVFKETPLPEVLRCLANFYNVDFKVMDPVLDSYRFTGTFNNRQLPQVLDYLRISSRIDYSIKRMEMDDSLSEQREQVVLRRIK